VSKKANPTAIGLFIVLGLGLTVGALLLFSSVKFLGKSERYILYFDSSVKGLNPGAPVKFRGVTVGSVREVLIRHSQRANDTHIPVIITVEESLIRKKTDRTIEMSDDETFRVMVEKGLRGMLQAQSLLTGILYVELEVLPNSPPPRLHQIGKEYKEIPTVPTHFQALLEKFSEIDITGTVDQISAVFAQLEKRLDELKMAEISDGVTNLLTSLNRITQAPDLTNSLVSLHKTLNEYRLLSETLRARIDPLADRADGTLREVQTTIVELRQDLQDVRDLLAPQAPLRRDLALAMNEFAEAARSINGLAEYLTRHPDALLRGRSHQEPKP
jgi:paraquat-inducible protein B